MELWKKVTAVGIVFVSGVTIAECYIEATHEHAHKPANINYPFVKIRNKPYPWDASDCNMLDFKCKAEHAAKKK